MKINRITLIVFLLLGICLLLLSFLFYGYTETWKIFNIPTMLPAFADLRSWTHGAESLEKGFDPYIQNPDDPWGRICNYTRIWRIFYYFGLNSSHTIYIGIIFNLLFLISIPLFLSKEIVKMTVPIFLLTFFSPAVLLLAERGNQDIVSFFLCSLSIFFLNRKSKYNRIFFSVFLYLAFVLKLFPLFGYLVFGKYSLNKKNYIFWFVSILFILVYLTVTFQDLILIAKGTPQSLGLSYGIKGIFFIFSGFLSKFYYGYTVSFSSKSQLILNLIIYPTFILYFLISFYFGFKNSFKRTSKKLDEKSLDSFRMGAAIYLGTFLLGMNFEYRLVFLLFTIPQLAFWFENEKGRNIYFIRILIICSLFSVWTSFFSFPLRLVLLQFIHWTMFGLFSYFLAYSMPNWLRKKFVSFRYAKVP